MVRYERQHDKEPDYYIVGLNTDFEFPLHFHRCFELTLVLEGEMQVRREKDKDNFTLKAGDMIFVGNNCMRIDLSIYNKLTDMKNLGYDTTGITGLLRFELTLKRAYIRRFGKLTDKYLTLTELPNLLNSVLTSAPELMQKHIASPLWSGAMLYKDLQKKYIRIYCKSKTARRDSMMAYRKNANRYGVFENEPTVVKHFEAAGVSPLYLNGDIRNIPSFSDLLAGTRNERVERFLQLHS